MEEGSANSVLNTQFIVTRMDAHLLMCVIFVQPTHAVRHRQIGYVGAETHHANFQDCGIQR
jgi:hypothetical protein